MHLEQWQGHCRDSVTYCHRGVRPGCRIDHQRMGLAARLLDPVNHFTFMVGLAKLQPALQLGGGAATQLFDGRQRICAVGLRLAGA
ncbi:hypothetical protein D3C80_1737630 [compost metagenome]